MPLFGRGWQPYFEGRHVLITGASEGVGAELAKLLVPAGARVTLVSRTAPKLRAAEAAALAALPPGAPAAAPGGRPRTLVAPADVTDEAALRAAVAAAVDEMGDVDILLTCAGAAECGAPKGQKGARGARAPPGRRAIAAAAGEAAQLRASGGRPQR
jgi:NAD(P)-dependent dehydrogenase (short-subunit alcohol dehydrogenase family)